MIPFTSYTFGSMSLGKNPSDIANDLVVARRAMDAGVWFHSSPTYNNGFTFMVLRAAFDADRSRLPRMILKGRDGSPSLMRFEVEDSCRRLGLDGIDVAQLVSMDPKPGNLVDQLRSGGGPLVEELASLRARGLIRQTVIFLTPENSVAAVEAAGSEFIDGVTLYWNVCQRECHSEAWTAIQEQKLPVLALRTLGGGPADPRSAEKYSNALKIIAEAPCSNVSELALCHAASEPLVKTTIGGTSSLAHLEEFLAAAQTAQPLAEGLITQIEKLQTS